MPKMVIFNGRGNWESFIYQFERIALRCEWGPARKKERLLDCLADQALDYIQKRGAHGEYLELRGALEQRFMNKDTASLARKQLHNARQREDETLEEFSQRVHFLAMDGWPEAGDITQQQIAVEAFLIGCRDKRAAEVVMEREPRTIYEAQVMVKTNINNHKALFGSRSSSQRVAFVDELDQERLDVRNAQTSTSQPGSPARAKLDPNLAKLKEEITASYEGELKSLREFQQQQASTMKQIQETLATMAKQQQGRPPWTSPQRSSSPTSSQGRRSPSPKSKMECHYCKELGHFRHECPKLKDRQYTESRDSQQLNC